MDMVNRIINMFRKNKIIEDVSSIRKTKTSAYKTYRMTSSHYRHNPHGPAFVSPSGEYSQFYLNGKHHNITGPSIVVNGSSIFYINGHSIMHRTEKR